MGIDEKLARAWVKKFMREYGALMDNWEKTLKLLDRLGIDIWPYARESLMREQEYGGD